MTSIDRSSDRRHPVAGFPVRLWIAVALLEGSAQRRASQRGAEPSRDELVSDRTLELGA